MGNDGFEQRPMVAGCSWRRPAVALSYITPTRNGEDPVGWKARLTCRPVRRSSRRLPGGRAGDRLTG